jgi:IclR family KDG regulon transcriptional repressor
VLNTIANAGLVLDLFSREKPEWGVSELARAADLPKSNVHALLTSLVEIGLLSRTSRNRYCLGWYLSVLSSTMKAGSGLELQAKPEMQTLAAQLRETVLLAVLARERVLYIERVEGSHPTVRLAGVRVGADLPLYCTAVGKVFLAEEPEPRARQLLAQSTLVARTERTITSVDVLVKNLDEVRRDGVGYDICECVADACCIAAPIRNLAGHLVAALSVSMPAYRFERSVERVRVDLVDIAETIGRKLGDQGRSAAGATVALV